MSEKKNFQKGQLIFSVGSQADALYEVMNGKVAIYRNYNLEDQKLLVELDQYKFFGEMAIVNDEPRTATAVALTDCTLTKISKDEFTDYIKEKPEKFLAILQAASARLRDLTGDYMKASKAVKEYVEDQEQGKEHSKELIATMKEIAGIAKNKKY